MEFATPPTLTGNPGQPRDLQCALNGKTLTDRKTELSSRPKRSFRTCGFLNRQELPNGVPKTSSSSYRGMEGAAGDSRDRVWRRPA
jgi:hypothetical protein